MSVMLKLKCNGQCGAEVEVGPLRRRHVPIISERSGWCTVETDDLDSLTPEGWVMFDPYTFMTYCPACWAEVTADEPSEATA